MKTREIALYILSAIVVFAFFALMCILVYVSIPEQNKDILNIVVGALIGAFTSIISYHFGSSAGSKQKTEMIKDN